MAFAERDLQLDKFKLARLLTAPIFFSGLVVENTTRCNAKCAMCYQSAGPKGSNLLGKAQLTVEEIAPVILEAAEIEAIYPRFHLSGGEAFLNIDSCYKLFEIAKVAGFQSITTTTNAYWARSRKKAKEVAARLREVGVTSMEISWDYWHQPYIPADAVNHCIEACHETEIATNLRVLSTRSHSYHEALSLLDINSIDRATKITCGPVFPTGRAAKEIPYDEFHSQDNLNAACFTMLNLTVNATGDVFPCCAGIDQTNNYLFGNVRRQSVQEIIDSMNESWLLRALVVGGVSTFLPILEKSGINIKKDHKNMCHLCWSIFSKEEYVSVIESYFTELQTQALHAGIFELQELETAGDFHSDGANVSVN